MLPTHYNNTTFIICIKSAPQQQEMATDRNLGGRVSCGGPFKPFTTASCAAGAGAAARAHPCPVSLQPFMVFVLLRPARYNGIMSPRGGSLKAPEEDAAKACELLS